MSAQSLLGTAPLPALPHWEQTPADLPAAIRQIKAALRARIAASGRTVEEVFAVVERQVETDVDEITAAQAGGETIWPVLDYSDIAAGTVSAELQARLHRRGCLVVRGHFDSEQALGWDRDIVDYVERNKFFENYRGPADDFFGSVGSKPEIYPIYWSSAQMQARQHDRMAQVQRFLNRQWKYESEGAQWFDPDRDSLYPDRIRRRPQGADSAGLGTHLDPGNLDLWMTEAYQQAFRHLFDGTVEEYDPWDAAYRTAGPQYPGTTMCSAFRTFQGWTALSDMAHDQGVLHTVPIPGAMAYLMLRPLLADVPDDDMCGVTLNRTFPANETWHPLLIRALCGIPDIQAGDSVWWHCDMIHSVAPVADQQGWGNVMYIPAAPWCPRNERYAASVRDAFVTGSSPSDFPAEHYERTWTNRFRPQDLNDTGRRGLGLAAGRTEVGRAADAGICLARPEISAHHAELHWDGPLLQMRDLSSTNGTEVNGHRVSAWTALHDGDRASRAGGPSCAPAEPPARPRASCWPRISYRLQELAAAQPV